MSITNIKNIYSLVFLIFAVSIVNIIRASDYLQDDLYMRAFIKGNERAAKAVAKDPNFDINKPAIILNNLTPLQKAAQIGHLVIVRLLLNPELHATEDNKAKALELARGANNIYIIQALTPYIPIEYKPTKPTTDEAKIFFRKFRNDFGAMCNSLPNVRAKIASYVRDYRNKIDKFLTLLSTKEQDYDK